MTYYILLILYLLSGSNIYDNDDRLSCCKESKSAICQEGCQGILRSSSDDSEIMNELEAVCDQPHLMVSKSLKNVFNLDMRFSSFAFPHQWLCQRQ